MPSSSDKYTDPQLREEVKEEVKQGDKGGAPGQWSARKAQMMASEYKKRGGGYKTDKSDQDERQKNLNKWTEEEWQTKDGSGHAKKEDGTQQRYLPKKAWENMSEEEKKETDQKKQEASKKGQQFVPNTEKAKESRKKAQEGGDDEDSADQEAEEKPALRRSTRKRSSPSTADNSSSSDTQANKRQKISSGKATKAKQQEGTHGSKHDKHDPPEGTEPATKDQLPKKGQQVHWKAMPGWCHGKVTEIIKKDKSVNGRNVKASESAPKIAIRSDGPSKKIAVHNVDKVYFVHAH